MSGIGNSNTWKIKDSGDRTVFESGAVRDCPVGKGRCDLLPLKEIEEWLRCNNRYEINCLGTLNDVKNYFEEDQKQLIEDFGCTGYSWYMEALYSALNGFLRYKWRDYISCIDDSMIDKEFKDNIDEYTKNADLLKLKTTAILEVSKHFEDGAAKYGDNNWKKGIPINRYIDSAIRHYIKVLRGDTDERHDRAFMWNILCLIWTVENVVLSQYTVSSEHVE